MSPNLIKAASLVRQLPALASKLPRKWQTLAAGGLVVFALALTWPELFFALRAGLPPAVCDSVTWGCLTTAAGLLGWSAKISDRKGKAVKRALDVSLHSAPPGYMLVSADAAQGQVVPK